ncbi:hypothetical protein EVAR_57400_1 [Eumeta japonica]|uniref:Uncharacterized protein n=1 Tax=Eumeta variegata TaxID=151549 RepID=A0A4C1YGN9_EUMVA|nr:hypothetical protein EVAR_57400_1 [Eumeta japonica]
MILYDFKCQIKPEESFEGLQTAFKNKSPSKTSVYRLLKEFKRRRVPLTGEKEGRYFAAVTEEKGDKFCSRKLANYVEENSEYTVFEPPVSREGLPHLGRHLNLSKDLVPLEKEAFVDFAHASLRVSFLPLFQAHHSYRPFRVRQRESITMHYRLFERNRGPDRSPTLSTNVTALWSEDVKSRTICHPSALSSSVELHAVTSTMTMKKQFPLYISNVCVISPFKMYSASRKSQRSTSLHLLPHHVLHTLTLPPGFKQTYCTRSRYVPMDMSPSKYTDKTPILKFPADRSSCDVFVVEGHHCREI